MPSTGEITQNGLESETRAFDGRLKRLEDLVGQLEQGGIPLDESLRLFEEGMELLQKLQSVLAVVESRIEELVIHGSEGTTTRPLSIPE